MAVFCGLHSGEYFINNDPGEGSATALEAKDGAFDSLYEEVSLSGIDISGLPVGDHRIGIRFKDKAGNWSVIQYRGFRVQDGDVELEPEVVSGGEASGNHLVTAEYFINDDPGEGSATALEAKDGAFDSLYEEVSLSGIDISGLPVGDHRIGIRFKDKAGNWSVIQYRGFRVQDGDVELEPEVVSGGEASGNHLVTAEYFINDDPGEGSATALEAKDGAFDSLYEEINSDVAIAKLKGGVHRIGIRFRGKEGHWSLPNFHYVKVYDFGEPEDTELPVITLKGDAVVTLMKGEAFEDPGATAQDGVDGDLTDDISVESDLDTNIPGEYTLVYSVTDLSGNVSEKLTRKVIVVGKTLPALVWNQPEATTYGTLLGGDQLNAKAVVEGKYVYFPQRGSFLNAGEYTLKVNFIPDDLDLYEVAKTEVVLTVKKAPLVIRVQDESRKYGQPNPEFKVIYDGFVKGEDKFDLLKFPVVATNAKQDSPAGNYPIKVSGAEAQNYQINHINGTLTVSKEATLISWSQPEAIIYGTLLGEDQLNAVAEVEGTYVYSPTGGEKLKAGEHTLKVTFIPDDLDQHEVVKAETKLTVNKAPLVIRVQSETRKYGESNPEFKLTYEGFIEGEGVDDLLKLPVATTAAKQDSPGGTYAITVSEAEALNYLISYIDGTLAVGEAAPTFTWQQPSAIIYGTLLGSVQLNAKSEIEGVIVYSPFAGKLLEVGQHTLKATFVPDDLVDHKVQRIEVLLRVEKAPLMIKALDHSKGAGENNPAFEFVYEGFVNDENESVLLVKPTISSAAKTSSPAGSYVINVSGATAKNYDITHVNGVLTVIDGDQDKDGLLDSVEVEVYKTNPRLADTDGDGLQDKDELYEYNTDPLNPDTDGDGHSDGDEIAMGTNPHDKEDFNKQIKPVITWATPEAITYGDLLSEVQLNASANVEGLFTYEPKLGTKLAAGEHTLKATFIPENAALDPVVTEVALVVNRRPLLVQAKPATRVYGDPNPAFGASISNFAPGEDLSVLTAFPELTTDATETSPVGTYVITPTGGSGPNYILAYSVSELTVTKAPLTARAVNQARAFGEANPMLEIVFEGFRNGETADVLTVPVVATSPAGEASGAGEYPIVLSGGEAANYEIKLVNGTLTVGKQTPVITWTTPEAITYGIPLGQAQLGAKADVAGTFEYSPSIGVILDSGETTLRVTFTPDDKAAHTTAETSVVLAVEKAQLSLRAEDVSRDYGLENPEFELVYDGFVNGEDADVMVEPVSVDTLATVDSPAGDYPIRLSGGEAANYEITLTNGTLTVGRKIPVVTWAAPAPITYGTALGQAQLRAKGDVAGAFVYSPPTGAILDAGEVTLRATFTPANLDGYSKVDKEVMLNVNKAMLVVRAKNLTVEFGDALPALEVDYEGFVNGEDADVLTQKPGIEVSAVGTSPPGQYPILITGGIAQNYLFTHKNGILTIVVTDSDSDGLSDRDEVNKFKTNPLLVDTDGDGLTDGDEVNIHKTNPLVADTDGDGLSDGDEISKHKTDPLLVDSDSDGFSDRVEVAAGTDPRSNTSNPGVDTDKDGLTDIEEKTEHKTNPNVADTDGDGLSDGDEVNVHKTNPLVADTDEDGLSDGDEINKYKTNPLLVDTDRDGLSDWVEINKYKTNPNVADTDGDGVKDGDEVNIHKTHPLLADTDGDGLPDGHEVKRSKTNPLISDTDKDETSDGDEVEAGTDPNDPNDFPIDVVAPVITAPPDTVFAQLGDNVMFKVEARGVPIAYQWLKNGKPIDGAQANLLRLFDISNDDVAAYTVEVSNQAGKVVSFPAFLKIVSTPPVISDIPKRFDLVYESGETIILDPKIKTEGPTTFQWDKNGNELAGETKPILIIENVKDDDAGNYSVDATNLAGTTVSETMRVSVMDKTKIGKHVENNFIKITGFIDSSPAIGQDGSVYYSVAGEFGYLYRHEPNGVRKWGLAFDSALRGSPAIDDNGIIHVLEDAGALHAVSNQGSKGKIEWSYKLEGEEVNATDEEREYGNSPAIAEDGTIIFGWFDSNVYAVKEGELVWKFPTEGRVVASPSIAPDGTIYIGTEDGFMYAIKPDGSAAWTNPFETGAKIMTRPAVDTEGNIYFGSFSGEFYALEPSRAPKWKFDTGQDIWTSAVIRADGTVYFGADDGYFYALDTESGKVKWTYEIEANWQQSSTAALGLDGSIYFTLYDNTFYAINRIGEALWTVKLEGDGEDRATFSSPSLLDDGKIYVGTKDGKDGVINVIQGGSPIDIESPWPSFGGDMQNTGRVMVKRTDAESFKAELRVIEASGDSVKIQITGDAFETYKLQYSNDLKVWNVVPDLQSIQTNFRGKAEFIRSPKPGSMPVFYRLRSD